MLEFVFQSLLVKHPFGESQSTNNFRLGLSLLRDGRPKIHHLAFQFGSLVNMFV
jgi:hypothetical protein